jgi:transcriptional regulator with XRE-family HTH domain
MRQLKVATLKTLRDYMVTKSGGMRPGRFIAQNRAICGRLDKALSEFRAARQAVAEGDNGSWLRAVRQATGVPVNVLAQRLGVTKHEIFRLEKSERERRIVLANLQRAAAALGCELVYVLVPKEGSLKGMAAAERAARESACAMAKKSGREYQEKIERWVGLSGAAR